jgi:hypothetical protein
LRRAARSSANFEGLSRHLRKAETIQLEAIRRGCLKFARYFPRKPYKSLILKYYLLTKHVFCVTDHGTKKNPRAGA